MASPFDGLDLTDACAVWPVLEKAYLELVAGKSVTRVMFGQQDVMFAQGNIQELRRLRDEKKAECQAAQAGVTKPRRRAFRGAFR